MWIAQGNAPKQTNWDSSVEKSSGDEDSIVIPVFCSMPLDISYTVLLNIVEKAGRKRENHTGKLNHLRTLFKLMFFIKFCIQLNFCWERTILFFILHIPHMMSRLHILNHIELDLADKILEKFSVRFSYFATYQDYTQMPVQRSCLSADFYYKNNEQ